MLSSVSCVTDSKNGDAGMEMFQVKVKVAENRLGDGEIGRPAEGKECCSFICGHFYGRLCLDAWKAICVI